MAIESKRGKKTTMANADEIQHKRECMRKRERGRERMIMIIEQNINGVGFFLHVDYEARSFDRFT